MEIPDNEWIASIVNGREDYIAIAVIMESTELPRHQANEYCVCVESSCKHLLKP